MAFDSFLAIPILIAVFASLVFLYEYLVTPNPDRASEKIKRPYGFLPLELADPTFEDRFTKSILISVFAVLAYLMTYIYLFALSMRAYYDANWDDENVRCHPLVIPFAGILKTPPPGMSSSEFATSNFNTCSQDYIKIMSKESTAALYDLTSGLTLLFEEVAEAINYIEIALYRLIQAIEEIMAALWNRFMNVLVPLQILLIKVYDIFKRLEASLIVLMYSMISLFDFVVSAFSTMVNASIGYLLMMLSLILSLIALSFIFPFLIPVTLSLIIIFTSISLPLGLIVDFLVEYLHIPQTEIPTSHPLVSLMRGLKRIGKKFQW